MGARVAILASLLAVLPAGCAGGGEAGPGPPTVTLYVSAPLRGEDGARGRAVVRGSRRALEEAGGEAGGVKVEAVHLDETSGEGAGARWDQVAVARNARRASRDASAVAYVDGAEPASLRTSSPIVGAAMMLHLAPARRGRWAAYGHEATAAVLGALDDAADATSRASVDDAFSPNRRVRRAEPLPRP